MSSATSFDLSSFAEVLRHSLLNRYRDCVVLLADEVYAWYDSVETISSPWLSHRCAAMGDKL